MRCVVLTRAAAARLCGWRRRCWRLWLPRLTFGWSGLQARGARPRRCGTGSLRKHSLRVGSCIRASLSAFAFRSFFVVLMPGRERVLHDDER
jgi:hypothetical protein